MLAGCAGTPSGAVILTPAECAGSALALAFGRRGTPPQDRKAGPEMDLPDELQGKHLTRRQLMERLGPDADRRQRPAERDRQVAWEPAGIEPELITSTSWPA
jgi:hypothetical protein